MCSLIFITVLLLIFMFNMTTYCMSENFINFTKDDKFFGSILYRVQHVSLGEIPHNHVLVDTGRKLNVHKISRTSSERLLYVQFTSCVYGSVDKNKYIISKNDLPVFFNKIYFTTEDKNSNQFLIDLFRTYVAKILRTFFLYHEKKNWNLIWNLSTIFRKRNIKFYLNSGKVTAVKCPMKQYPDFFMIGFLQQSLFYNRR